jgi:protein-disulfide isomerase
VASGTRNGGDSKLLQQRKAERAAAARAEQQRRERRRQLLTMVGAALAIALVVTAGFVINSMRDDSHPAAQAATVPPPGSQYGMTFGPDSAPHQVVVYEDFLCQVCGQFEKAGRKQLAQLAAQGQVQIEYRPVVLLSKLGTYSAASTLMWWLVLQHDGVHAAKTFHDLLYVHQPSEQGPFPSRDELYQLAGQAGVDTDALKASVESAEGTQEVADATKRARSVGIKGTPTVLIDGKPFTDWRTPADLATGLIEAVQ